MWNRTKRMMATAVLLALPVSACATDNPEPPMPEIIQRISLLKMNMIHEARFAKDSAELPQKQLLALEQFLSKTNARTGETVRIEYISASPTSLTSQRQDLLHSWFRDRGLNTEEVALPGAIDYRIRIIYEREVAQAPGCPNWENKDIAGNFNQPSANLGCATAINLLAMIADPRDLVHGRTTAPIRTDVMVNILRAKATAAEAGPAPLLSKEFKAGSD